MTSNSNQMRKIDHERERILFKTVKVFVAMFGNVYIDKEAEE